MNESKEFSKVSTLVKTCEQLLPYIHWPKSNEQSSVYPGTTCSLCAVYVFNDWCQGKIITDAHYAEISALGGPINCSRGNPGGWLKKIFFVNEQYISDDCEG